MDETLKVYGRIDGLLEDIAQAYRQVISGFAAAGCRYLQFDDCTWGMLCDEKFRCNPQVNAEEMAPPFCPDKRDGFELKTGRNDHYNARLPG